MATPEPLPDQLVVLLDGRVAGKLQRGTDRSLVAFTYESSWRDDRLAFPLSLSLPLAGRTYEGSRIDYYLRGLLPDSEKRLNAIAHEFGVSPDDSFALLAYIGEDCPGAVQFARPERLRNLTAAGPGKVDWLTKKELANMLRDLAGSSADEATVALTGQFSLPGALPKVALIRDEKADRWGRAAGRAASTHILKPPLAGVPYHNENEHLCLELAARCGLDAAKSSLLRVEDMQALVVTRYDRHRRRSIVSRLHQEDMSQALGANPRLKYSSEGAPGIADIVLLLREYSSNGLDDVYEFLKAVALNWILAATDAHPRNYSILISEGAQVAFAPLYDLASALVLPTRTDPEDLPFAMKVGGRKKIGAIGRAAWQAEAHELRLDPKRLVKEIRDLADTVEASVGALAESSMESGVDGHFAQRFASRVRNRAAACATDLLA